MNKDYYCPVCLGVGESTCKKCNGNGLVSKGNRLYLCKNCNLHGWASCWYCNGTGNVTKRKIFEAVKQGIITEDEIKLFLVDSKQIKSL